MCNECINENINKKESIKPRNFKNKRKSLVETHPHLIEEWDWEKNNNLGIKPENITYGSHIKVYWICSICNKSYNSIIKNRTLSDNNCPCCTGQKVCLENCLATLEPDLAKEWHPTLNETLTPFYVTCGSDKKVYWLCPICNENYKSTINNRTKGGGCSYCAGKKACLGNCLATLNPKVAIQWHPTKNGELTPYNVVPGSNKKVYWLCPDCNESYDTKISDRTKKDPTSCPYCAGKRVCLWNCLATLNPELAKEWHPTKNGSLTPFDVTLNSGKKIYWICSICKNEFYSIIASRNRLKNNSKLFGCPYCNNKKPYINNCLATLRPDLAAQWHPTLNGDLTPFDVTPHSDKIIYWICNNNSEHIWKVRIANRTNGTNCPICLIYYHEILCQEIMKKIFNKDFIKYKHSLLRNNKNNYPLELDCYNEELKINIEYDGKQHYEFPNKFHKTKQEFKNSQQNDRIKDQWCKDNNILQIRVSYKYDTKEEIETYIKDQLKLVGNTYFALSYDYLSNL